MIRKIDWTIITIIFSLFFTSLNVNACDDTFGTVKADGTKENSGSDDWNVTKESTGVYEITITPARRNEPIVFLTGLSTKNGANGPETDNTFTVFDISKDGFKVVTRSHSLSLRTEMGRCELGRMSQK